MSSQLLVSVIGASGYAGGEFLRLLSGHPRVKLSCITSETYKNSPVSAAFPGHRFPPLTFTALDLDLVSSSSDCVFMAQDHGVAMKIAPQLLAAGKKVIDLSADFRLSDTAQFAEWYKLEHSAPETLKEAVFGLPELYRKEICAARMIANPGCYPTASALALLPLLKHRLVALDSIIIDAKSGVSGAGRGKHSLNYHFPELNENFQAYGTGGKHRHTPEIEQVLSAAAGASLRVSFTPHLLPVTRGILATCYAKLSDASADMDEKKLEETYREFYSGEPFVVILDRGTSPSTKGVSGTNQCHISLAVDRRTNRITVLAAIDNLVKGAAGQAVQNMNLMFGFPETAGLEANGLWP